MGKIDLKELLNEYDEQDENIETTNCGLKDILAPINACEVKCCKTILTCNDNVEATTGFMICGGLIVGSGILAGLIYCCVDSGLGCESCAYAPCLICLCI